MATIEITPIEVLALKKLALINSALAQSLVNQTAKQEQATLTKLLVDIAGRADLANAAVAAREKAGGE